jgi:hypothetical protein
MRLRILAVLLVVGLLVACRDSPLQRGGNDARGYDGIAAEVSSVQLVEADSLYLAFPSSLGIDPRDGSFYVSDVQSGHAVRFDRTGAPRHVYGRPGPGPGELRLSTGVFVADSFVVVVDGRARALLLFDRDRAEYRRTVPVSGLSGNTFAPARRIAWVGARDEVRRTSVAAWHVNADSVVYLGPIPDEFHEFPNITRSDILPVVQWSDSLLVGFGPLNGLLLLDTAGHVLDTVVVPARNRRGTPEAVIRESGGSLSHLVNGISELMGLHRTPSGAFALVHFDSRITDERTFRITSTVYLSLVAADLNSACVDQLVPVRSESKPLVQFRGDTLFVLHRQVVDTTVTTAITAFHMRAERCDWQPMGRRKSMTG